MKDKERDSSNSPTS